MANSNGWECQPIKIIKINGRISVSVIVLREVFMKTEYQQTEMMNELFNTPISIRDQSFTDDPED